MSWTTPRTWVVGEQVTAALFNSAIRDDLAFLYTPPMVRAYNSANISVANNTVQALTYDSERFDTDTMHVTSGSTGRLTATTAGKYLIGAGVEFAANATGLRSAGVRRGGTSTQAGLSAPSIGGALAHPISVSSFSLAAAAEYFDSYAYQNCGGALNVNAAGEYSPEFWACWQGN